MILSILSRLIKLLPVKPAFAHCDIPCGIYDPKPAQLAAKTVLKMVQKINELPTNYNLPARRCYASSVAGGPTTNSLVRMIMVKEQYAELCKKEVLILWTDYFKDEHLEKFPDLHNLIWKTTKLCSENKRGVDEVKATELIEAVNTIADIFDKSKQ